MTPRSAGRRSALLIALLLSLAAAPSPSRGQQPEIWNDTRVLDLVGRARDVRSSNLVDSAFHAYQAEARGYVYFFIDRPDSDERTLVKADQIALELYWRAPDLTKQRIVGLRDEKVLPTNIRYHLDHLTVVQDDFGETIRLGDGDEVSAVPHPMAPGAPAVYDYRLADSLSIRYGGGSEEVRVYEISVRPKDAASPGFIGSVYVDRDAAAIVRMAFTFTPASYVDPHLDYIRIALDNSLWDGKYWLPYRQEVQLRRELPQLDFLAGSIIQGRFDIGQYEFNPQLPNILFLGRGVSALPAAEREAFPFERGLFDDLREVGLAPTPALEEVRAQAREILAERALSGLSPFRLHLNSFSDGIRYNRAEGLFLGGGTHIRPTPQAIVRLSGGYAFGAKRPTFGVSVTGEPGSIVPVIDLHWDRVQDMGIRPAVAPAVSSLGALTVREDFLDPYLVRAARLTIQGSRPKATPSVTLRWERHRSAARVLSDEFRDVRPVEEGVLRAVGLRAPFSLPLGGTAETRATVGRLADRTFASTMAVARWTSPREGRPLRTFIELAAGAATAQTPIQELFLLGGRGTLPGHDFRSFAGSRFWLARVEGTHPLLHPWVGIRTFASLGVTHLPTSTRLPPGWNPRDTDGLRAAIGAGLSLGWDVIRLDFARGLRDGRWQIIFAVDPQFHAWL